MMEGVDGFGILEHLRKESPQTLVTVITGYASMDLRIIRVNSGS